MRVKARALNRFLIRLPIHGGNCGRAFELEVTVQKVLVSHLQQKSESPLTFFSQAGLGLVPSH